MKYNPDIHHRRSIRLQEYDYSNQGAYYVTICVKDRECLFGPIHDGKMVLNDTGQMVNKWWNELAHKFMRIDLDEFVIMPNHMHGIIMINDDADCRGEVPSPFNCNGWTLALKTQGGETPPLRRKYTLGQIVAYYKYQTTRTINQNRNTPGISVWQRNYYDRVIRNEKELHAVRQYTRNNPLQWELDQYNPVNVQGRV